MGHIRIIYSLNFEKNIQKLVQLYLDHILENEIANF